MSQKSLMQKISELWTGYEVAYALENKLMRRALVAKYRHCIEKGFPNYDITNQDLL